MSIRAKVDSELVRLRLNPLTDDQAACLRDPRRLEEAAGMLGDLRDRCGVRLPSVQGVSVGGPFGSVSAARVCAISSAALHLVVAIDEIATDESRNTGSGNEFYVSGFDGEDAPVALAESTYWRAVWVHGSEKTAPPGQYG